MKKIAFVVITLFIICCGETTKTEFSLSGKTNGLEDGTMLYMRVENKSIDSTKIVNNAFVFNTKLPNSPLQIIISTKDFSQYRFLWAENKPMTFNATNSDFRHAEVIGSELENLSYSLIQKIDTLEDDERQKIEMDFVKNHPNSIVSASVLSIYATTWGKEKTVELFEQFTTENKNSKFGKEIATYIKLNKDPKIGDQFVDIASKNHKGELKKLSDLKGKVVLLEFWASWCGPCREENPNLVKSYENFHPKGFEIFAVSLDDDRGNWLEAIKKDNLNWEHVSDLKGSRNEASLVYGVNGIPDNFLIAENGEIIGRNLRGDELNQKLQEVLP